MNFIHERLPESDKPLFFGDNSGSIEGETFTNFGDEARLCHLLHMAGIFPSVGQAKKNGWNMPIPEGYSEHKVGKKKIYVLNAWPGCEK